MGRCHGEPIWMFDVEWKFQNAAHPRSPLLLVVETNHSLGAFYGLCLVKQLVLARDGLPYEKKECYSWLSRHVAVETLIEHGEEVFR